jgi:Ca-activated chloride channel family protein
VRVDLVRLSVAVTDAKGNFIRNLPKESFRVLDEGVEQPIAFFASAEEPARVLILLEASPAVYLIAQQHLLAAHLLLDGLARDDEVALATYAQSATLRAEFSPDKQAVRQILASPQFSLGRAELHLYDALAAALVWLGRGPGKKSVVLLSTGIDSGNPGRWQSLLPYLQATDVSVYAVALGGSLREANPADKRGGKRRIAEVDPGAAETFGRASRELQEITRMTGGQAFFARTASDFPAIYRNIATALRHQYSLGFNAVTRDGRYRRIEVQLRNGAENPAGEKGSAGFRISARAGYLAPQP